MATQTPAYLLPGYGITDLQAGDTIDPSFLPTGGSETDPVASAALTTHAALSTSAHGGLVASNDARLTDSRTPLSHTHAPSEVTGTAVVTADSRLSDARTPTAHNQAWSTITSTPTTVAGYNITDAAALRVVQTSAPTTGQTTTFNILSKNEQVALTHSATIAAHTLVFPTNANSQIGQELAVFARSIVTAVTLTLNSNTIYGTALTTLPASGNARWRKTAASIWVRVQ